MAASSIHSENGLGSSAKVPGADAGAVAAQEVSDGGGLGMGGGLAILVGGVLVAAAAAVMGRRVARNRGT